MNQYKDIFKQITLLSQLGLSILMPLLMCLVICMLLTQKTGLGEWIYIPGFIMGLGSSFMTAYKFYTAQLNKNKENERKDKVFFNKHL